MIAFVKGTVVDIAEDFVILENQGMGYHIFTPGSVQARIRTGQEVKLHTYLNVREDAMQLFGFLTKDDLKVYKLLISVSGIGPKAALAILSVMSANDLRYAVMAGDSKAISKAPGIGNKTAQKVILELKDKLDIEEVFLVDEEAEAISTSGDYTDMIQEAVLVLSALGYSQTDAMKAVRRCEITDGMTVETLLKLALKQLY